VRKAHVVCDWNEAIGFSSNKTDQAAEALAIETLPT
jgi:hypothetical protein